MQGRNMMEKKLEILAPAGSFESLKAAVNAGADAVYMGGGRFGARAYADNPEGERLLEAIDYAHLHGVKLYLTVNTLLKEQELNGDLYAYLKPCYEHGLDAVIVQDLGVLRAIRRWFPDMHIHASTQMTLCGAGGAAYMEREGVQRIVLARELSLGEIEEIHRSTSLEIECFVHGALCYCYSGQCLFSSILGGRSGNRGRCAQPCRLAYDVLADGEVISQKGENALLSPKDICTVDLIPKIAQAGIYSLKIEGRMKRPEYVAGVVRIYRKYVDWYLEHGADGYRVSEKDKKELLLLFNRDGFSRGYYEQHNGRNMMALRNLKQTDQEKRDYEALIASLRRDYVDTEKKIPICGTFQARAGVPLRLSVYPVERFSGPGGEFASQTGDAKDFPKGAALCTVFGEYPQIPKNRPMEEAQLRKQLQKLGNTPFVWEELKIEMDGPLFIPVQDLNSLRRDAAEQLHRMLVERTWRQELSEQGSDGYPETGVCEKSVPELHISVETLEQLQKVLYESEHLKQNSGAALTSVYVDGAWLKEELPGLMDRIHACNLKAYVIFPTIFRMHTAKRYEECSDFWRHLDADGYVIKNLEEYEFLNRIGWDRERILDHNVYIFNQESRKLWREAGITMQTNPLELNGKELRALSGRDCVQIIYGRYPMMTTAGCLHKTLGRCRKEPEQWILKDRYQKEFPVKNNCRDCYNVIYNSQPLYLLDQMEELSKLGAGAYRIMFTTEKAKETEQVLSGWLGAAKPQTEFTRGHFKRGVE